ncbi:MAG TPA: DPP IV N-terminal domain-containing protein [Gemmataceae bacterium]|nr:DPP IV N-terminal domain-containing protein [Gemmataceae bacterium]
MDTSYLKDHAETRGFMLGRPARPKLTPDGKAVLFLRARPRVARLRLYEFDVATGKTRELVTPEELLPSADEHLSAEEKARRERQRVSVGGFTDFQLSDDGANVLLSLSGRLYLVSRADRKVTELKTGPGVIDPKFSPDGRAVSYVRDHDVYLYDLAGGAERRVTTGGSERKPHGLAEFIAQEEMHRFTGYWWSPDARFVVYQENDAAGVEVWHVCDPMRPELPPQPMPYPRPGKSNVAVRLGIIPAAGGDTVWIEWDAKKYPYLARVRWGKTGPLTILVQTREQKEIALLQVDPKTGKTTTLLTEHDDAWVDLPDDVPRWLPEGRGFLWVGEQPGGPRLELRDTSGRFVRAVVPADAGFQGLVDFDARAGRVVYRASTDPTQSHLWRVSLDGGKPERLTKAPGLHAAVFSRDHSVYVHTATPAGAMPRATVRRADGTTAGDLPSVAEEPPFHPNAELLKVGEGDGYYAAVVRPRRFRPGTRYPVIMHVYGGPTHQMVTAAMGTRLIDQWLADQGFIVASVDNRGTSGRGRAWEKAVYDKFGSVPLADQVAGLKALGAKFPEMDLGRVGVYGWSFGGYLAALAVLREPEVFKAAVAGAPVVDWRDYDTHYTERYLGLPDSHAEAYREASLLTYAKDLRRPLLLLHGTADDNVYFRHTLRLTNDLFREGRDFDLLPLPGLTHMVPDPVVMQRMYGKFAGYFKKHLGEPEG